MTRYLSEKEPTSKPTITPEEALKALKNKFPRNHGKTIRVNKAELEFMKLEILTLRKENIELKARLDTNRAQVKAMAEEKRRRTPRAADKCPACVNGVVTSESGLQITCPACAGRGIRRSRKSSA